MAGYDGSFEFDSDTYFPPEFDFVKTRAFAASFGLGLATLAYATIREFRCHRWAAFLGAWMVLFDNALVAITRYILLDAMLLFFIGQVVYCQLRFQELDRETKTFVCLFSCDQGTCN